MTDVKLEFDQPRSFQQFVATLVRHGLITIEKGPPTFQDREQFVEFGFALFVAWLVLSVRTNNVAIRFIRIGDSHTLLLVQSVDRQGMMPSIGEAEELPPFCVDDLSNAWPHQEADPFGCLFTNSLRFNGSSLQVGRFINRERLEIIGSCRPGIECLQCRIGQVEQLNTLIVEFPEAGRLLGGYPLLVRVKPEVFWEALSYVDPDKPDKGFCALVDSFLTVAAGIETAAQVAQANTCLQKPYQSWELDGVLWNKKQSRLLILETSAQTTSEYALRLGQEILKAWKSISGFIRAQDVRMASPRDHLKQKLLSFTAFRNIGVTKLSYVLLCLFDDEVNELAEGTLAQVARPTDKDFRFVVVGWPEEMKHVRGDLRRDWWDPQKLRELFDYYLTTVIGEARNTLR